MKLTPILGIWCLAIVGTSFAIQPKQQDRALETEFKKHIGPLIQSHCSKCHGGKEPAGNLILSNQVNLDDLAKNRALWNKIIFNVKSRTMPPNGGLDDAQRLQIVTWYERALSSDCKLADAGRVTLRRLNRLQYQNTVQDLLGIKLDLTKDFPSDDVGEGFDNIGDVLTVSPLLFEKYLSAAELATAAAIKTPREFDLEFDLGSMALTEGVSLTDNAELGYFATGIASAEFVTTEAGEYTLEFSAWAQQAGTEAARLLIVSDHNVLGLVSVTAKNGEIAEFKIPANIKAGQHTLTLKFDNDFYDPKNPDPAQRDRNLYVSKFKITKPISKATLPNGPITALPKSDSDIDTPMAVLSAFASKAFRRPATKQEVERLLKLYSLERSKKEPYESAIQTCIQAILTSPTFLFRVENGAKLGADQPLNDYEIATRLSYFLWGSMPDNVLLGLAKAGQLKDTKALSAQVSLMLNSSRARVLSSDFAAQWLQLRRIDSCSPDPKMFPEFNDELKADMLREVENLFMDTIYQNKSILTLVDSDRVFVNDRLAKLYGIQNVIGANFREVKVADLNRGGLFGTAAFLTVTSNPNRTSPVKRGKWILEQILGTPPPSPPPNVGNLPEDTVIKPTLPMKQRLEIHRNNPACSNCHRTMDALGYSLENLDPIGRYRNKDGDLDVDSSGELPDGTKINGVSDLKKMIQSRKRDFVRCLTEKMLVYAIGRGLRTEDSCHIEKIVDTVEASGYKMQALIVAVVTSDPFRKVSPSVEKN